MNKIPIGAGYNCYKCNNHEEHIMWDLETIPNKCTKCGGSDFHTYVIGKESNLYFIFVYKRNKWLLVDGYKDGDNLEKDYKKISSGIRAVFSWSAYSGMHLSVIDGLTKLSHGFDLNLIIKGARMNVLPNYTQVWRQIERFTQRYWMGFVTLKDEEIG